MASGLTFKSSTPFWVKFCIQYAKMFVSVLFITESCLTLCDPVDCGMPGLPVHHQLPEPAQLMSMSWWCHPTISSSVLLFSSGLQSFPASGSFPRSQFFSSGGQNIGISTSASVPPMNIWDWFPLGLTGLISLQSKRLSRVFFCMWTILKSLLNLLQYLFCFMF